MNEKRLNSGWLSKSKKPGSVLVSAASILLLSITVGFISYFAFYGHARSDKTTYADVEPVFERHCVECHSGLFARGRYNLSSYDFAVSSRIRARVVPGNKEASEMIRRIRGQARPSMPLDRPVMSREQIELVEKWVDKGARDARGNPADVPVNALVQIHGTLTGYWKLDDLTLLIDEDTRMDDTPEPGDYVQVRGVVEKKGGIRATRIRPR